MTDKPFALFLGDDYYPGGGWRDFVGFFETMDEAVAAAVEPEEDCVSGWWFNVADLRTGQIVASKSGLPTRWRNPMRDAPDELIKEAAPPGLDEPASDFPSLDVILAGKGDAL
jgi:hypothetical protein